MAVLAVIQTVLGQAGVRRVYSLLLVVNGALYSHPCHCLQVPSQYPRRTRAYMGQLSLALAVQPLAASASTLLRIYVIQCFQTLLTEKGQCSVLKTP